MGEEMPMLRQSDLSRLRCNCGKCGGGVFYFHARCHPDAPPWVMYHPDGFLHITCSVCDKVVADVVVAKTETEREP